jgi:hypothetical protein
VERHEEPQMVNGTILEPQNNAASESKSRLFKILRQVGELLSSSPIALHLTHVQENGR